MKESPLYQEILAEGRAEGRAQGVVESRRADIADVLGLRFGEEAVREFAEPLRRIPDPDRLADLLRLAVRCRGVPDFRRGLARGRTRR
jgi:hypothetical protein